MARLCRLSPNQPNALGHARIRAKPDRNLNLYDGNIGKLQCQGCGLDLVKHGRTIWVQLPPEERVNDVGLIILEECLTDFESMRDHVMAIPGGLGLIKRRDDAITFEFGYPAVAEEVFILGFPKGINAQGAMPIWKRGSIASEPKFYALDNEPIILIDAVTRSGMSGAPVLFFGRTVSDSDGAPVEIDPDQPWLVGVYAGREGVSQAEIEMTLGRVWRKELIDELIFNGVPGPYFGPP